MAIIASSYAFIHRRNLVNEALPQFVVKSPEFHALVQEDQELVIDLETGEVEHVASGRKFQIERPSSSIRAIMQEGGLVPAIRRHGPRALHMGRS